MILYLENIDMVKMSSFNNFMLLFLTLFVVSLATSNVTISSNQTIPHLSESALILKGNSPEEKRAQHMGRENIQDEKVHDNSRGTVLTTKVEYPQEVKQVKISTVEGNKSEQHVDFSKIITDTPINTVTKVVTQVENKSIARPNEKHTTIKPHKPLKTVHDDIPALTEDKLKMMVTADIPNIDETLNKKTKRADYVIPIVAVILSVPLVTIIISLLYKRSKDWWQHRNYRRMDYLIEGMYNS